MHLQSIERLKSGRRCKWPNKRLKIVVRILVSQEISTKETVGLGTKRSYSGLVQNPIRRPKTIRRPKSKPRGGMH
jgi:hypothetical protein